MSFTGFNQLKEYLCSTYIIRAFEKHGPSAINYIIESTDYSFDLKYFMTNHLGFVITPSTDRNLKIKFGVHINENFSTSTKTIVYDDSYVPVDDLYELLRQTLALYILKSSQSYYIPLKIDFELGYFDTQDPIIEVLATENSENDGEIATAYHICRLFEY